MLNKEYKRVLVGNFHSLTGHTPTKHSACAWRCVECPGESNEQGKHCAVSQRTLTDFHSTQKFLKSPNKTIWPLSGSHYYGKVLNSSNY